MNAEQLQTIKARRDVSKLPPWYAYPGNAPADVDDLIAEVERLQAYVVRLEQTIDRKDAALERGHQVQNELHRKLAEYQP